MSDMSEEDANQRWKAVSRSWGISPTDTLGVERELALEETETILEEADARRALRACQTLLADPQGPAIQDRTCLTNLFDAFSNDAWKQAGQGDRAPWVLQGLLVAAWPGEGVAVDVAALFDEVWLGRLGYERQVETLADWRERVMGRSLELVEVPNDDVREAFDHARSDVRAAIRVLAETGYQQVPFTTFGPQLGRLFRAAFDTIRLIAPVQLSDEIVDDLSFLESATADLKYNQYSTNLINILDSMIDIVQSTDLQSWESLYFLKHHKDSGHVSQSVIWKIIDVVNSVLQTAENHARTQQLPTHVDSSSVRAEVDLLWWGQAGYSHRLCKPFRKLEDVDTRLLYAAVEAAERSTRLPPGPAAAYLVQVLSNLGVDIATPQPLGDWMGALLQTLSVDEHRKALAMCSRFVAVVEDDALGLPASFVRLLAKEGKSSLTPDASERVGLDLDVSIDQGDWASILYREFRLERMFEDDET